MREKIKLVSSAETGHYYTTTKNKRIHPEKVEVKKFDPELKYIRKWVTDLDDLTYPLPIVEHKFARERCLKTYKEALL